MFKASSAVLQVEPVRENYSITQLAVVRYPTAMRSISSGFGYRRSPCWGCSSYHEGVDITPGSGTPVVAIARGTVVDAGWSGGYGVYVEIQHVINGATVTSFYGHMQSGSLAVGVGARVAMGQRIGRVGNTGSSTGAHLHFEIRVGGGRAVEPLGWIRQHRN
jgi:murein DD-endopeptidase MepM/ murein hydrolase activator NlpD